MRASLSILGMYNYDNSIFDDLLIPSQMVKEDVINNLLMECAEFEVVYTNFDFLKAAIGFWSKKRLPIWDKMYATTVLEYNPIWNKDGTMTYTDKETRDLNVDSTETRNLQTENNESRDLVTTASGSNDGSYGDNSKDYTFGFNSETEAEKARKANDGTTHNITTGHGTDTGSINRDGSDTGTIKHDTNDTGTVLHEYERKEYGNIGVTTTQAMIREERQVSEFDIIAYIINDFKKRFCIMVY